MKSLREAYPVILTPTESGYSVYVPDFNINTQGEDLADALYMARDAIGLAGIDMVDDGFALPVPESVKYDCASNEMVSIVNIDFAEYRRLFDSRDVKRDGTSDYYDSTLKKVEEAKFINEGITDYKAGRIEDGEKALKELRKKHGI